ncbi:hypothetical protein Clacol_009379 [Clathrus columnatus]|uniref:Uncharacterized protein n=1 Tax=Clathrus columnatus TaxID=1419009 RepID=A0AAV5AKF4_9AGAM|nr:hypothetical protein Clacol_009379 [Clathrus columnatus]
MAAADLAPIISLGQCNDVVLLAGVSQILSFIGTQGLVSIRAYSLCQGNRRPIAGALSITFLTALIIQIYGTLRFCFVLAISTAQIFLVLYLTEFNDPLQVSALILCEFAVGLRKRDKKSLVLNSPALSLPILSSQENPAQTVRSVLGRLHESIVTEMGERNDISAMDTQGPQASISRLPGEANEGPQDENQLEEDVEHRLVVENNMV